MFKKIKYIYCYIKVSNLQDRIGSLFFTEFNKTKRTTLWYMAGKNKGYADAIDYAFFKVYHLWGIDGLTDAEKRGF